MELLDHPDSEATITNPNRLYRFYSFGRSIVGWSFLFWLIYTIIYQFVDGWHWAPVSTSEKILDLLVSTVWEIGVLIMVICWVQKMDQTMEKTKFDC